MNNEAVLESVREYYGEVLTGSSDLKTSVCCCVGTLPAAHRRILAEIHEEILAKSYGCGSPIPAALEGCQVLDLGCGTGRDAYLCSRLVGPEGNVTGIDMTEAQLVVARRHLPEQMTRFDYSTPNVEFRHGFIEDLAGAGIPDASVDVVISNCVINLSPDKPRVFREVFRVLKPGGELYMADVFCDRRLPAQLKQDPVLMGECLAGAMYIEDFRRLLGRLGCPDIRTVSVTPIEIQDDVVREKLGEAQFFSVTLRAFKVDSLEDRCEDFEQQAVYQGGIEGQEDLFVLDDHHTFEQGTPLRVCGNTALMLAKTRFAPFFTIHGDQSVHYGLFDCAGEHDGACCVRGDGCC